ncbi:hypothetical protein AOA59_10485 [Pseudomonas sp. 2822-15]|uniref:hypothetical protein n=1 Tax=Pseudomonas sp. 2822-15 TaxID=1712677 RepID=UPI000C148F98|nr:hypothetical protein [Pseudomonas sp. 2822-15]PIB44737.1 hypothetical protein AOA59_10485 [Pseudomonas sp. 2822-15]
MINLIIPPLLFPYFLTWRSGSYTEAALLSLVVLIVLCYKGLRHKFVIDWSVACGFVLVACISYAEPGFFSLSYTKPLIYALLAVAGWGSYCIGKPFTLQYAKLEAPEEVWHTPAFFFINKHITLMWNAVFSLNFGLAVLSLMFNDYWPIYLLMSYFTILCAVVFTQKYPDYYLAQGERNRAV